MKNVGISNGKYIFKNLFEYCFIFNLKNNFFTLRFLQAAIVGLPLKFTTSLFHYAFLNIEPRGSAFDVCEQNSIIS